MKKNLFNLSFVVLLNAFFVTACNKDLRVGLTSLEQPSKQEPVPPIVDNPGDEIPINENPDESFPEICSALNFDGVDWPEDVEPLSQLAFALGLNVSGSFEGHSGWQNLSNNFDGQGVSMGLLNQNLGQGSLQPLWIGLRERSPWVLDQVLSPSQKKSMLDMLANWERSRAPLVSMSLEEDLSLEFEERQPIEILDENVDKKYGTFTLSQSSNSSSVQWSKRTLYTDSNGRRFRPEWRKALKEMASHPDYVTLQIEASQRIHNVAEIYARRLSWIQLRSYLFLFDIIVQNGGLASRHFQRFFDWYEDNSQMSEQEQVRKMLEIRVVDSNPKWQKDVRIRKSSIINDTGFVHGEKRNLPQEFCYEPEFVLYE